MSNNIERGDVVIVDFTSTYPQAGVRPALVVQNDRDNQQMSNTIVLQITTNIRSATKDTKLLIDESHPDWDDSGLRAPSVVTASNIITIPLDDITHIIGSLSDQTMQEIDKCLKAALGII